MPSPATQTTLALGIDIGGTKIAIAAADQAGNIHQQASILTLAQTSTASDVFDRLADALHQFALPQVIGIGIACPGPVNPVGAVALNAVNLGWQRVRMADELAARGFAHPVYAANDVNAGAVGEGVFGAARGMGDFVYLAVGTGLGGGAVVNNRLVNGVTGAAMEVGHVALSAEHARSGRLCACGRRGCAETVISGIGLVAGLRERLSATDAPDWHTHDLVPSAILNASNAGDALAQEVINEAGDALGLVMAWCATAFNPAMIVIGGGLGLAAYDQLLPRAQAMFQLAALPQTVEPLHITRSQVASPALGAAALVWQEHT